MAIANNLESPLWNAFSDFLCRSWRDEFHHSYCIGSHRSWNQWYERCHQQRNKASTWSCANLGEASERYSWHPPDSDEAAVKLRSALERNEPEKVADACLGIFQWGGVARAKNDPSRQWVLQQKEYLPEKIKRAVALLKDPSGELSEFNGSTLLMNSAMTKVYSAADRDHTLAIYDGRVGAALGLLAREFLKSIGSETVPDELRFSWGNSRDRHVKGQRNKRDPSDDARSFPNLFRGPRKDFHHAVMMRKASLLLQKVVQVLGHEASVHHFERALFMVGYDVSGRNA
jgi:hypothetical protein